MNLIECKNCGNKQLEEKADKYVCPFCNSVFMKSNQQKNVNANLNDDVQRLLQKCKKYPSKAKQYARLALELDPNNREAKKYL